MTSVGASGSNLSLTSPNKANLGHCTINVLTQKRWSLHVSICIRYRDSKGDSSDIHQDAIAKVFPVRWPHPLASAEKLPSYQLLNIQAEYIKTGKYDKNLLYDTAQLISFPSVNVENDSCATVRLSRNKEKVIKMNITIPENFPDDLLNVPLFVELLGTVEHLQAEASLTLCMMVIG